MSIAIRSSKEIALLRKANQIVAGALDLAQEEIRVGMTSLELDRKIEDYIFSCGAKPAFKGLYGFPNATCISVNEVIIHGIPSQRKFESGDIVGVDIGTNFNGWFGDGARTFKVGEVSEADSKITDAAKEVLDIAVSEIRVGMHFKQLSEILERETRQRGYVPLKDYCGHGIGRKPHEEPNILNYVVGKPKQGPKIKNGMVFCVEPMLCQKDGDFIILEDNWAVVSKDGLSGSHFEYAVAIIDGVADILTLKGC